MDTACTWFVCASLQVRVAGEASAPPLLGSGHLQRHPRRRSHQGMRLETLAALPCTSDRVQLCCG
eukprot:987094-Alexandrium_andersonii.AAC.1